MKPAEKMLVSAAEAAALLSIGKSTFYRKVAAGELPTAVHMGAAVRWRVRELQAYVDRLANSGGERLAA